MTKPDTSSEKWFRGLVLLGGISLVLYGFGGIVMILSVFNDRAPSGRGGRDFCVNYCAEVQGTLLEVTFTPPHTLPSCVCAVYDHPFSVEGRP